MQVLKACLVKSSLILIALVSLAAGEIFAGSSSSLVYPLMGPRLSSEYGMRIHPIRRFWKDHHGVDLAAPKGASIRAIADGRVVFSDPYKGYGNLVVLQHIKGVTSHYAHCDKLYVNPGQVVKAGQVIATVGNTGLSTGPHLHFEIRKRGVPVDPERLFPGIAGAGSG